ncbi:MAG: CPBP family intramembrane metalloprotease [Anaerolineae bacterium]|nr:CPBP family intramembrane metalloprotease [Anaerolineae bacterium]
MKSRALAHALLFALLALAYSWAIFLAFDVWLIPTLANQIDASLVAVVGMFGHFLGMAGPALAALIMWRYPASTLRPAWNWSRARYYLGIAAAVLVWRGVALAAGALETSNELALRNPFESYLWLLLVGGLTFGWVAGMGEELGWCAYLLPLLAPTFRKIGAVTLSGIVRGLWHLPVVIVPLILVASQDKASQQALGVTVLTAALALVVSNILFGAAMGWLWFKTESIPLVGWAHQWFDVARDFGLLLAAGTASSDAAMLLWSVGIHLLGLGALGWLARQEFRKQKEIRL